MAALAEGFRSPFARYRLSGFLSDLGEGIRLAALPLLAAQFTRSPMAIAAVTQRPRLIPPAPVVR